MPEAYASVGRGTVLNGCFLGVVGVSIMVVRRLLGVALVCLLAVPAVAAEALPTAQAPLILAADSVEGRLQAALASAKAGSGSKSYTGEADDLAAAKAFYAARQFAPLWVAGGVLNGRAALIIAELARSDDWGLKAADFVVPARDGTLSPVDAELALTQAVLKYARFARGGRIADPSSELSEFIDRKPQIIAPQTVMEKISTVPLADVALRGFHPQHPQFERLRQAYITERAKEQQSAAVLLPSGPMLVPERVHPNVAFLRRRLGVATPDVTTSTTTPDLLFDPALVAAVKRFQAANGLKADGLVGERTRLALNGERKLRLPALIANMEQWRWMPETLGPTYVLVNIPEYEMRVVSGAQVIHSERVVTGKVETATPAFSADLQTIVFQPKWGVPDSIKINELLPLLQDGRGLRSGLRMSLNGREIDPWNVDWSRADITRYHVYQPSGDDNALGVVKFLFPNKHAVYLHDTPSKRLFNTERRSYSHGCVRVRNPVRLAELLLAADKNWSAKRVRELVEDGPEDNPIKLETKLPVHITYFTASADETGKVSTFADVYGHERRITLALEGRADQIVKLNPQPLATTAAAATGNGDAPVNVRPKRRRSVEAEYRETEYAPPSGLGFAPSSPAPTKYKAGSRFHGNTTNDVIMRALGGF